MENNAHARETGGGVSSSFLIIPAGEEAYRFDSLQYEARKTTTAWITLTKRTVEHLPQ
jgi:hypothetical protein